MIGLKSDKNICKTFGGAFWWSSSSDRALGLEGDMGELWRLDPSRRRWEGTHLGNQPTIVQKNLSWCCSKTKPCTVCPIARSSCLVGAKMRKTSVGQKWEMWLYFFFYLTWILGKTLKDRSISVGYLTVLQSIALGKRIFQTLINHCWFLSIF